MILAHMPENCPYGGCGMAVIEDSQFLRDMQEYDIQRTRVHCAAGHTSYVGELPPEFVERRPIPERRALRELAQRQCQVCGSSFTPMQSHAKYCPDPNCKAFARTQREAARNTKLASEGRNKSGWQIMSAESLRIARAFPEMRHRPKAAPRPFPLDPADVDEEVA